MRHKVRGRKFGRERDHRRLLMRNLVSSLVEHGRINTTQTKAKELRGLAERLITYGKKDTIHYRRLAYKVLQNRDLVKKVFDELAPRYLSTEGGYTRVLKNGYRKGDSAPMAIIEFVEKEETLAKKEKKIKTKDLTK
ncbi:MAG: 50S ribosomal protein L17 [Candidatus Cloacimonetes bacterium]|nr:50S ribosomal protein L17 [Candidatus Cloacimonadota bacterium]MBL7148732.1 50S ribosomal protein L17 [Candidatus Cloacimonadota bacterium]